MAPGCRTALAYRALVGVAALCCATGARADDRQLPEVTSEGRSEPLSSAETKEPTAFTTTIERHLGEATRTSDLVLAAPGAIVRDFGLNQPATVSLRGSSPDQVLVLLDDVPLNPSSGGGVDLSLVPLPLVDRISVMRGAVGARYGSGAVGGVVSLETRRIAAGERAWFGELSYGSFGTASGSAGFAGALSERVSALVSAFARSSEGDFRYGEPLRPQVAPDDLTWTTRENNRARVLGGLLRLNVSGPIEGSALVEIDGGERGVPGTFGALTPDKRQDDLKGIGVGTLAFSVGGVRLQTRLAARLSRLHYGTWTDPGAPQDDSTLSAEVSAQKLWGHHAFELGATVGRDSLSSADAGDHARGRFGVYLSDELSWSFLTVVPALRFERIGRDDGLSPKLGLRVPIGELVAIKANVGRSFRVPSFGELYLDQGGLAPNAELKPETGTYVDLGPELHLEGLAASANVYWGLYDNLILYELYAPLRAKPFNFGRAEVWGAELEARGQLGPLNASLAYTLAFTANRLDDPLYLDKELPYRPRHRLHARVAAEVWRLEGHLEGDLQSSQWVNRTNTDSVDARARFDLGASVAIDRGLGLSLHADLKNILGSRAQDLYGYPLPGRAVYLAVRIDTPHRSNP